jgi:hypothetical protein
VSKKRNPAIQKAYEEGVRVGFKQGFEQGKYSATCYMASRFDGLGKVKGIGPKTMEIIVNHFGREYFESEGKK